MNSYWDLYVAYVHHCVEYNKKHDIDPHHYVMEWNHFLPKSVFGDQPLGQYLLLKQHAIASALQTLAFKKRCMFGWHKKYLPDPLLKLAWPYYCEASKKQGKETARMKLGAHAPQHKGKGGKKTVEMKTGLFGLSLENKKEAEREGGKVVGKRPRWTNGITNRYCDEKPGPGWYPGFTGCEVGKLLRWTDGVTNRYCNEQPGPGWYLGVTHKNRKTAP